MSPMTMFGCAGLAVYDQICVAAVPLIMYSRTIDPCVAMLLLLLKMRRRLRASRWMPWLPPVQVAPVIVAVLPFMIQVVDPSERLTFAIWLLCRFENTSESSSFEYWMLFRW